MKKQEEKLSNGMVILVSLAMLFMIIGLGFSLVVVYRYLNNHFVVIPSELDMRIKMLERVVYPYMNNKYNI